MQASAFIRLVLATMVVAAPVHAQQQAATDGLRDSLTDMVSLITLGSISVANPSVQVTPSGGDIRVRLPLAGFVAPADAAAEAIAHSDGKGGWDVASMALPSAGALGASIDRAVSYSIGQQSIHGLLDPRLLIPSTLTADLRSITLKSVGGPRDFNQAIERIVMDGRMTAAGNGRLDLATRTAATNWHSVVADPAGKKTTSDVQRLDGHFAVTDLDRAQGVRLMQAVRSFMTTMRSHEPDTGPSSAARDNLLTMLDATTGLATRAEADETFDAVTLDLGGGRTAALGRLQLRMTSEAREQLLQTAVDLDIDSIAPTLAPADVMPRHVVAKAVAAGLPIAPLMALLRDRLRPDPDPVALQQQMGALLDIPGAWVGLESITFDAGAVHILGSARLLPRANGEIGTDIHIIATGLEPMLVQLQRQPGLQAAVPILFMAKGMGRAEGDSIVWDISVGGGPTTVNGIPFGQPSTQTR